MNHDTEIPTYPDYLADARIVSPDIVGDDTMVEIRWSDLRRFADAFVCAYHGVPDEDAIVTAMWGWRFANAILKSGEEVF